MLKHLVAGVRQNDPTPLVRATVRFAAAAVLGLFALALYAPALGGSLFIYGTDTVSHDYIMHMYAWVVSIGQHGELPLWNPYMFSGAPMIASAAICPFYPSQWLYAILPFNTGFTLQYVLALMVGGIGAAWWMRCLGHRRSICLWAGFLYMVSGHFLTLTHAGHLQKMIALGWTPIALGATIQLVRFGKGGVRHSRRYKAAFLLGFALAMQLLASHPQIFYATAAACVLQLIGMSLTSVRWKSIKINEIVSGSIKPAKALRPVGRAVAMSLLALVVCALISAVQLFPSWEMSNLSNRANGVSFAEAVETSYPPLEVLEYAIPQVFGDSVRGSAVPYFGSWGERIVSDYIGLPVLFLALVGLFGSKRRYRWFLLILCIAGFLIGIGKYTPVYWLLYHILPGFASFRSPGTYMFLTNCGLIGLAALGMDYLTSLADTVNNKGWDSSFTESAESENVSTPTAPRPMPSGADDTQPFHIDDVPYEGTDTPPQNPSIDYDDLESDPGLEYSYTGPDQGNVTSSNFTWDNENIPWLGRPIILVFIAAMALVALVGAIIALAQNWDVDLKIATPEEMMSYHVYERIAGAAVAIMCTLGAILLLRLRTWTGVAALGLVSLAFPLYHNYHFIQFEPLTPYMAHLTRQPDLHSLAQKASRPIRLLEENALKNEDMLYGISSVAGYHPVISEAYSVMAGTLGLGSDAFGQMFAVNHARTTSDEPPADQGWTEDEDKATGPNGGRLWKRSDMIPYVRDLAQVSLVDTEFNSLTTATATALSQPVQSDNPSYVARISESDAHRFHITEGQQRAEAQLRLYMPHEVRLHTRAVENKDGGGALLPVSDPYFPGWRAETSEGERLPVIAVNGAQRGVVIPPGEHKIRFIFAPFSFRLGLFVSLISVTLFVSFGIGTLSRRIIKGQKRVKKVIKRAQTGSQPVIDQRIES